MFVVLLAFAERALSDLRKCLPIRADSNRSSLRSKTIITEFYCTVQDMIFEFIDTLDRDLSCNHPTIALHLTAVTLLQSHFNQLLTMTITARPVVILWLLCYHKSSKVSTTLKVITQLGVLLERWTSGRVQLVNLDTYANNPCRPHPPKKCPSSTSSLEVVAGSDYFRIWFTVTQLGFDHSPILLVLAGGNLLQGMLGWVGGPDGFPPVGLWTCDVFEVVLERSPSEEHVSLAGAWVCAIPHPSALVGYCSNSDPEERLRTLVAASARITIAVYSALLPHLSPRLKRTQILTDVYFGLASVQNAASVLSLRRLHLIVLDFADMGSDNDKQSADSTQIHPDLRIEQILIHFLCVWV